MPRELWVESPKSHCPLSQVFQIFIFFAKRNTLRFDLKLRVPAAYEQKKWLCLEVSEQTCWDLLLAMALTSFQKWGYG